MGYLGGGEVRGRGFLGYCVEILEILGASGEVLVLVIGGIISHNSAQLNISPQLPQLCRLAMVVFAQDFLSAMVVLAHPITVCQHFPRSPKFAHLCLPAPVINWTLLLWRLLLRLDCCFYTNV